MFDGFSVGVHLVDVDTSDSRVMGIVVEQIEEIHVCPDIVSDGDDPVHAETAHEDASVELADADRPDRVGAEAQAVDLRRGAVDDLHHER